MKRLLSTTLLGLALAAPVAAQVAPQYALAPGQAAQPDSYRIYVQVYDIDTRQRLDGYSERYAFPSLKACTEQVTKHFPHDRDLTEGTDLQISKLQSVSYTNGYEMSRQTRRILTSTFCTQINAEDEPRTPAPKPLFNVADERFRDGRVNPDGLNSQARPR